MTSHASRILSCALLLALGSGLPACASNVVTDLGEEAEEGAGGGPSGDGSSGDGGASTGVASTHGVTASASSGQVTGASGGGEGGAGDDGSGGAGGRGPSPSEVCEETAAIAIDGVGLDVEAWRPGESATVLVTLTSPIDHFQYPGIRIHADHPGVGADNHENHLFGLIAGQPVTLGLTFTAADDLEPGTNVTFDVEVVTLAEECAGLDHESLVVTLE